MKEGFFFERHSIRSDKSNDPESEQYPGITENGVEAMKEQASKVQEIIDQASPNAVIYIGGTTEEKRTRSTIDVLGDHLADLYKESADVLVLTHSGIDQMESKQDEIASVIADNPNKRIVACYPLFLKELSLRPFFRQKETGAHTEFSKRLYEKGRGSEEAATHVFMKENPVTGFANYPITPQELAERHIQGINRLKEFSSRFTADREVILGIVGHGWNLDSLASYLANKGNANYEGFQESGGHEIGQGEIGVVEIGDDRAVFKYRGKEFEIPKEIL